MPVVAARRYSAGSSVFAGETQERHNRGARMRRSSFRRAGVASVAIAAAVALAGCGSSSKKSSSTTTSSGGGTVNISVTSFTSDFSAMAGLKSLAAKGKGKVAVLLPDTQSSQRYVQYDAPFLARAFQAVGLSPSDYQIQNAQGSPSTMSTQADAAITNGASVLLVDPLDSGSGAAIEKNAAAKGVKTIDYDRLTLNGSSSYYVSFDNVRVGKLIGQGFVDCVTAWNVQKPDRTQADAAITNGASVLLVDPLDSGSGAAIEKNAAAKGVKTIDYDRLTLNGSSSYYVSFDNVRVGKLIGQGFVDCVTAWNVQKPQVLIMNGDPTDNNASLFSQGYHSVLDPKFADGSYTKVAEPAGTWDNQKALT